MPSISFTPSSAAATNYRAGIYDFKNILWEGRTAPVRQYYADLWTQLYDKSPEVSNELYNLGNMLKARDSYSQWVINTVDRFWDYLQKPLEDKSKLYQNLEATALKHLAKNRNIYESTYWPNWSQTKLVNDYFMGLWKQLANQQATAQAIAAWQAEKYGLSDNARRAILNKVGADATEKLNQAFQWEIAQVDNINKTYNSLIDNIAQRWLQIRDAYTKSLWDQKFQLENQLWQIALNLMLNDQELKNRLWLSWSSSSWSSSSWSSGSKVVSLTSPKVWPTITNKYSELNFLPLQKAPLTKNTTATTFTSKK